MNHHGEKERLTSVSILCRITLQNAPYMDYKSLVLMSFEVTIVTSMDSQEFVPLWWWPPAGFLTNTHCVNLPRLHSAYEPRP